VISINRINHRENTEDTEKKGRCSFANQTENLLLEIEKRTLFCISSVLSVNSVVNALRQMD